LGEVVPSRRASETRRALEERDAKGVVERGRARLVVERFVLGSAPEHLES
jgi:hypothetical protein